jgi:iron complex outermembrane receptor protein
MKLQGFLMSSTAALAFGIPLVTASPASAQQSHAAPSASASTSSDDANAPLEEVVVTARRREENLQKVPLAVTAFTPEQIAHEGIDDRTALADHTPSLITITGGYPSEFALFALRGQGPAFGSAPGVITYFAEVPNIINIDGRVGSYYDLANVQVLAGPQGTLFGRNATGGNILFQPQRPTDYFGGYVRGELGNYNDHRLEGAINLPINNRIQLRIAGEGGQRDGYTTDVGPYFHGKDYDNLNYGSGRISVLMEPTDALELYTVGRYYHSDTNGGGTVPIAFNPAAGAPNPFFPPQFLHVTDFYPGIVGAVAGQAAMGPRHVAYDFDQFANTTDWQILNQATYRLNDNLRIKNIMSYSEFRNIYGYDYDATIYPIAGQGQRGDVPTNALNTYTEELQLQGSILDQAVNFATGVYADRTDIAQGGHFEQFPISVFAGTIPVFAATHAKSQAVFGQATVDMGHFSQPLHGLSLTAGYRYTWEELDNSLIIFAPPATTGSGDFHYGSYNLTADYAFSPDVHAYIALRDAYKAGGLNLGIPAGQEFHEFPPEQLSDIELGLKSQFHLGEMPVRADLAIYDGEYKNIQRTTSEIVDNVTANVTRGAADGRIRGLEFTGAIVPFHGFTLTGNYSYTESKYGRTTDASAEAILAGSPFPYTPMRKFTISATYEHDLQQLGTLVLNATYAQQSDFSTAQTNQTYIKQIPGYGLLNLSADLNNIGRSGVDLTVFVDNATDKTYWTGVADFYNQAFGVATATYGAPRMYGVRFRYRFGG